MRKPGKCASYAIFRAEDYSRRPAYDIARPDLVSEDVFDRIYFMAETVWYSVEHALLVYVNFPRWPRRNEV